MNKNYHVAVLSFQRPKEVVRKTLRILANGGVPGKNICVYLHENDPYLDDYEIALEALGVDFWVTSTTGTKEQRAEIYGRFPEGHHIVSMDDDIERLVTTGEDGKLTDVVDVDYLIQEAFQWTDRAGLFAWGLYTSTNAYFMKDRYSEGLRPFTYCMFGVLNRPGHQVHDLTTQYCDDMEFCLRSWWWDGGVVRKDNVAVVQEYLSEGGFNASGRNLSAIHEDNLRLNMQWPDFTRLKEGAGGVSWIKPKTLKRRDPMPLTTPPPGWSLDDINEII